jgi:ketosteroid isomerase-like protein
MRRLLPLLLLAASCSKEAPLPPDIAQSRESIREIIKKYHAAGDEGDVDTMKSLLAPEISMFKGQEDFVRGIQACGAELTERVKHYEGQKRGTIVGREEIAITGDVAVATYVASVLGAQRAAITAVFRRFDGKWRISHLHESWPPAGK